MEQLGKYGGITKMEITHADLSFLRLTKSGIFRPFADAHAVMQSHIGMQSQVQQYAEFAINNRLTDRLSSAQFQANYDEKHILNIWAQRKTLHMIAPSDLPLLNKIYQNFGYLSQQTPAADVWMIQAVAQLILEHLAAHPLATKQDLAAIVEKFAVDNHAHKHFVPYRVLGHLTVNSTLVAKPNKPYVKQFYAQSELGLPAYSGSLNDAIDEMVLRYLKGYGPATIKDFIHWSGINAPIAKQAFTRIDHQLQAIEVTSFTGRYYAVADDPDLQLLAHKTVPTTITLLGKFDPLTVSFHQKDWLIPAEFTKFVWYQTQIEGLVLAGIDVLGV